MTLHEMKDRVWYQEPGCAVQYMRDGDNWYLRENAIGNPITISSFPQRIALCTTFRPVAPDPVEDPVEEAWREADHGAWVPAGSAEQTRGVAHLFFVAGWSARERRGMQIDVEAAMAAQAQGRDCVLNVLRRINSGEFRK